MNMAAIQYVKFNSVPIDPTAEFNFKNQASPAKNKENQKDGLSTSISNGLATNDIKSQR